MRIAELNEMTPEQLDQLKQKLDDEIKAFPELGKVLETRKRLTTALQDILILMLMNEEIFGALTGQVPREAWQIMSDFAEMEKKHGVLKRNG